MVNEDFEIEHNAEIPSQGSKVKKSYGEWKFKACENRKTGVYLW